MSGAFGADRSSLGQVPLRDRLAGRHVPTSLRGGIPAGLVRHLDPDVKAAWEDALSAIFPDSPITTVEVPIDESRDIVGALYRLGCADAVSQIPEGRRADLHVDLLQFIEPVKALRTEDLLELQRRREEIASRTTALLTDSVDVLLTPTMPCLPPRVDAPSAAMVDWLEWCPFTPLFNLSHGPAISVPWHGRVGSLPIGLQVGAAPGREGVAVAVAAVIEALDRRRATTRLRSAVDVG